MKRELSACALAIIAAVTVVKLTKGPNAIALQHFSPRPRIPRGVIRQLPPEARN